MNNIKDLRNELVGVFSDLRSGAIKAKDASEMNNSAGKIISTLKTEIEYSSKRGEKPDIEFMNCS